MPVPKVKRTAYPLEIEGQTFYIRSLTVGEGKAIDSLLPNDSMTPEQSEQTWKDREWLWLVYGWCDVDGNAQLNDTPEERESLNQLPMNWVATLLHTISTHGKSPLKKS